MKELIERCNHCVSTSIHKISPLKLKLWLIQDQQTFFIGTLRDHRVNLKGDAWFLTDIHLIVLIGAMS